MSDTAIAAVPPDVALLGMVRAARLEGLPLPTGVTVGWRNNLHLHLGSETDAAEWQTWWTRHGADSWEARIDVNDEPDLGRSSIHHRATGQWRGHTVQIVHIDQHKLEVPA